MIPSLRLIVTKTAPQHAALLRAIEAYEASDYLLRSGSKLGAIHACGCVQEVIGNFFVEGLVDLPTYQDLSTLLTTQTERIIRP